MKCPTCGHDPEAQIKGGKNRWKGMTKKQKSKEMFKIRKLGIARKANPELSNGGKADNE